MKMQIPFAAALAFGLAGGLTTAAFADDDSGTDTQKIGSNPDTGGATQQDRDTMADIQAQIEKQKQQAPQQ